MNSDDIRRKIEAKSKEKQKAEEKASDFSIKESNKRSEAASARLAAGKTKSNGTRKAKLRRAEMLENQAKLAGKAAYPWSQKAKRRGREIVELEKRLNSALKAERLRAQREQARTSKQAEQAAKAQQEAVERKVGQATAEVAAVARELRAPKPEQLRVLLLGSSSDGELRVGREQKRIRTAVEAAQHRDLIELDVRPAATAEDLLDGISKFRPHVVHFSGHSNEKLIVLEREQDEPHEGAIVTAQAFASAVAATDEPPLLVLLNSCGSAAQIGDLVAQVAPFAIGMTDSIADTDAISYAAQFYAAIANGQSIQASHLAGKAALELAGLDSAQLPILATADDVDPAEARLVESAR